METLLLLVRHHGYSIVALLLFLEAIGLPVPAAVALLAGGAASAAGKLHPGWLLAAAVPATMAGDLLLFILGRYTGWTLLGLLCRIAANPEACILRSAESFYKRGRVTLVIAKFIPGINTMAPPLAGSMNMGVPQFLGLDFLGSTLYALVYGGLGFLFSGLLTDIVRTIGTVGRTAEWLVVVMIAAYIAYRMRLYWTHRLYRAVPRVLVDEVARKLAGEDIENIEIVDVRSHGYYDRGATRIHPSIRLDPNNLKESVARLSKEKKIYLYCT